MPVRRLTLLTLPVILLFLASARAEEARPLEFHVTYDATVSKKPFSGRVLVMLTDNKNREPRFGPRWQNTEPFFAVDVKDWKPGTLLKLSSDSALCFPGPLHKLKKGS